MIIKRSGSDNEPDRDDEARFRAEQIKLQEKVIEQAESIMFMPKFLRGKRPFEAEVARFNIEFPDETACIEGLIRRVHKFVPWQCKCGSFSFIRQRGVIKVKCTECKKSRSALSHCKYFRYIRKPRLSLAIIWMKERCADFSIKQFSEAFGYAYSSCWHQSKKLEAVLHQYTESLQGVEQIYAGKFLECFTRRSLMTPMKAGPCAEQTYADANDCSINDLDATLDLSPDTDFDGPDAPAKPTKSTETIELDADAQTVYDLISDSPIQFDALCEKSGLAAGRVSSALTDLELDYLILKLPGDRFVLHKADKNNNNNQLGRCNPRHALIPEVYDADREEIEQGHTACADSIIPLIKQYHQGISRRYLPLSLADTWRSRTIWLTGKSVELFELCARATDCARKAIVDFECPFTVRIPAVL